MRFLPVLPVALALTLVAVLRPDLLTAATGSPVAWLVVTGIVLAAAGTRLLVRRWSPTAAPWAGSAVSLALLGVIFLPSFMDKTVNEQFPPVDQLRAAPADTTDPVATTAPPVSTKAPVPVTTTAPAAGATTVPAAVATPTTTAPVAKATTAAPKPVATTAAPAATATQAMAKRISSGAFEGINHRANGTGALYSYHGSYLVAFEKIDFDQQPGPVVYLVAKGARSPSGGIKLGAMKGNKGSFSYTLPSLDVSKAWTILVWCDPYNTPIAAADLS